MISWAKVTIRAIALGNSALGTAGLLLQADSAFRFSQKNQFSSAAPYETYAYWVMASISFALAFVAFLSGFFLWRADRSALRLCNWLFGSQLLYWVGKSILDIGLVTSKSEQAHLYATSIARATGIANMGTAPQIVLLYPVWALVLLNLAYWRMRKANPLFR